MKLFTYGSLMSQDIMDEVSGRRFPSFSATADGFQRFCVRNEHYPGMVADYAGTVEGVVYDEVDHVAMERLDIFEGEMYTRQTIQVKQKNDDELIEVMAYIVKPHYQHLLSEEIWSYREFLEKGKRLFTEQYAGFRVIEER
ncbi:gamma-glutamylcyclotransferase family protein [Desulfosediminicola sp.]|uniref:gamma-glutamylcyclotransferase family protein n=1 Tax=Desulfosediminicola sp. TaxID=2886825 RepID=UPI003AF2BBE9